MRGRKCSASFMRRFKALINKGMTDAELAEWFCFGIDEARILRKAIEAQKNVEEKQKETQNTTELIRRKSDVSPLDVATAKLDFEHIPPTTYFHISRAPKDQQLGLAVKASHRQLSSSYMKKKVDHLLGKPIKNPESIDTGIKFHCEICGNDYMIIHQHPDNHRFQKVKVL